VIRVHPTLLTLNLGRTHLTDAATDGVLAMVSEEPAPPAEGEAAAEDAEVVAEEPVPPNRTLTALSLAHNAIGTRGRLVLEATQLANPGLARLELVGNPCLTCGPTAGLGVAARSAINSSWAALTELDGGVEAVVSKLVAAALALVPEVLPLVGYEPPPPPEEAADGEAAEAADPKAPPSIDEWAGLAALSALVAAAVSKLVGMLGDPEALGAALKDYGLLCATRGVPAGSPYDVFGEQLISALGGALGDGFGEETATAWRDAFADAAQCMQQVYTPSQIAEAAAKAAAEAATVEEEGAES